MRVLRSRTKWVVLGTIVVAAAVGVGVAIATTTATLLTDTSDVRLRSVRMEFVPSADQPTFSSGWHTHPGPVIVQVQSGHLQLVQSCVTTVVRPGETYIETPELPLIATADDAATWTTTFIVPVGAPLASPADEPVCPDEENDGEHESEDEGEDEEEDDDD